MRNLVLTFCSMFIMFGGFLTAGMMVNPLYGAGTMLAGFLLFVVSLLKKPVLHKVVAIISFVLFLLAQGSITIIFILKAGIDISNGYFNLTLFLFVGPFVLFIISLISAFKKSPKIKTPNPETEKKETGGNMQLIDVSPETFFCPNCGSKQKKGTAFCGECGTSCANVITANDYDRIHKR